MRYVFIQDKVDSGKVNIKYCSTNQVWSDILTKPLQGHQFRLMRVMLMNCPIDYDEINEHKNSEKQLMIQKNKSMTS